MRVLSRILLPFVLLPGLLVGGCCNCGKTEKNTYPPTVISISEGGGVTGQFVGYTIDAEGNVYAWRGFAASKRDSSRVGALDSDAYRDLLHTTYQCNLPEVRQYETGNMTATLEVSSGELLYRFAWPGLWRASPSTPEQLRPLIEKLEILIDSLRSTQPIDSDIP
ncbi:MAG: hypothetical protein M5R41_01490 [Bacteroidia bacterium]|nr:hypothetical protein [Bacteroidia bacterium]